MLLEGKTKRATKSLILIANVVITQKVDTK